MVLGDLDRIRQEQGAANDKLTSQLEDDAKQRSDENTW